MDWQSVLALYFYRPSAHFMHQAADTQRGAARDRAAPQYSQVLRSIIQDLPSFDRLVMYQEDDFVIILDGFPKSRYHFLVIPHTKSLLRVDNIDELVNRERERGGIRALLEKLHALSREFAAELEKRTMCKFVCGFHSVPSCQPLHYHVLSYDLDGAKMNKKDHWNSFTREDFFVSAERVLAVMKEERARLDICRDKRENVMMKLRCPTCEIELDSFKKMKSHRTNCKSMRPVFKL